MISSEIVIAYTQCRRKAYHLMLSTNKPHTHEGSAKQVMIHYSDV